MQHLDQIKQVFLKEKAMSSRYLMRKYKITDLQAGYIMKQLCKDFNLKMELNKIVLV